MIRLLVRLGLWLSKRFPEKVIVTLEDYRDLHAKQALALEAIRQHSAAAASLSERMAKVEQWAQALKMLEADHALLSNSVAAIKDVLTKSGAAAPKPEKEQLRAAFIEDPSRFSLAPGAEK